MHRTQRPGGKEALQEANIAHLLSAEAEVLSHPDQMRVQHPQLGNELHRRTPLVNFIEDGDYDVVRRQR
jgi:hypothetical protein